MKRIIAIMLLASLGQMANAQQDTSSIEQYCQVIAVSKLLSNKSHVFIDFGQELNILTIKRAAIQDDSKKLKSFNSAIEAVNLMGQKGWTMVSAFPITEGNQQASIYIFKRRCSLSEVDKIRAELEDMTGGPIQKSTEKNFWE